MVEVAAAAPETSGGSGGGGGGSVTLNIGFVFVLFPQYAGGGGSTAGGGCGNVGGNGIFIEGIMGLAPQTMLLLSCPVFFCSPIVSTAAVVVFFMLFFIFTLNFDLDARFFNCNPIEDVSSKLKKEGKKIVKKLAFLSMNIE